MLVYTPARVLWVAVLGMQTPTILIAIFGLPLARSLQACSGERVVGLLIVAVAKRDIGLSGSADARSFSACKVPMLTLTKSISGRSRLTEVSNASALPFLHGATLTAARKGTETRYDKLARHFLAGL